MSISTIDPAQAPFRDTPFPPREIDLLRRDDGAIVMRSRLPLNVRESSLPGYLRRQAASRPDAVWLGQREAGDGPWRTVTFAEARRTVDNLTQGLIDLGLKPGDVVLILSGNSIGHALFMLAAMQAHLVIAPVSPAYALQSGDFAKLRDMAKTVRPSAVFVQSGTIYAAALEALELDGRPVIALDDPRANDVSYASLAEKVAGADVDKAFAAIDPAATAKLMFTSGSTGAPKAVMQSHRNLCVATESLLTCFGQTEEGKMVRLDWAPWSHVFGATNISLALAAGGALYIDDGRPVGDLFARSLRNLREISPTTYANVPAGYAALVPELEKDDALARGFFSRLDMLGYAAAAMPDDLVKRLQALAVRHSGCRIPLVSGYGSTETCPAAACVYWPTDRVGLIGLVQPGYEIKLVPADEERYEVRIRGEGVMAGYYGRPELNAEVFDAEGYYRMGDAVTFADPDDPLEGLVFAGRLAEEFKLQTGIFVRTGSLRGAAIDAAAPLLQDVVVCGENQPYIAILAWLNVDAARAFIGEPAASRQELNASPLIRARIAESLAAHNVRNPASSMKIVRFHLLDEPASIDRGEITDKGSINQRAVQRLRQPLVAALFSNDPPADVVGV